MKLTLNEYLAAFSQSDNLVSLTGIGRGIEREALRVLPEGKLSEHPHYSELGAALTHPTITTDYSETLLEFITPVSQSPETAIAQLQDTQKYTFSNINGELLWPMSMPCFVHDADKVQLANYGTSNIGKMKTAYRQGLKNRYGSMMQVIAGIHFNFSFSKSFWQTLKKLDENEQKIDDFISDKYFKLLRNYKKYSWLIPYLYGSSPVICPSFLQGKTPDLPFKKSKIGYLYLEHATSLRMSDLGYTNSEQADLHICYNNLDGYVDSVKKAMALPSDNFSKFGIKVDGKYQQLNSNILQIENELYAPVRPKQVAKAGEKPSEALSNRGVEYVEVRALDVNPFSDTGISTEQVYFLDIFLTYCALKEINELDDETQHDFEENMNEVVNRGRDPELKLIHHRQPKLLKTWGQEIFAEMSEVATLLDKAYKTKNYSAAIERELAKINEPSLTPSAEILRLLLEENTGVAEFALNKASEYRTEALARDYQFYDASYFDKAKEDSVAAQKAIEAGDTLSFDDFLKDYFSQG